MIRDFRCYSTKHEVGLNLKEAGSIHHGNYMYRFKETTPCKTSVAFVCGHILL